jgi:hypothetical protein
LGGRHIFILFAAALPWCELRDLCMAIALRFPAVDPVPMSSVSGQNNTYRRRYGTIIDTNFARLLDGGQLAVRYVTADVPMAACRSAANQNAFAGVVLVHAYAGPAYAFVAVGAAGGMRPSPCSLSRGSQMADYERISV